MNVPKEKGGDKKCMPVGMLKKMHKEMLKEMNIVASRKESPQQQFAS